MGGAGVLVEHLLPGSDWAVLGRLAEVAVAGGSVGAVWQHGNVFRRVVFLSKLDVLS